MIPCTFPPTHPSDWLTLYKDARKSESLPLTQQSLPPPNLVTFKPRFFQVKNLANFWKAKYTLFVFDSSFGKYVTAFYGVFFPSVSLRQILLPYHPFRALRPLWSFIRHTHHSNRMQNDNGECVDLYIPRKWYVLKAFLARALLLTIWLAFGQLGFQPNHPRQGSRLRADVLCWRRWEWPVPKLPDCFRHLRCSSTNGIYCCLGPGTYFIFIIASFRANLTTA